MTAYHLIHPEQPLDIFLQLRSCSGGNFGELPIFEVNILFFFLGLHFQIVFHPPPHCKKIERRFLNPGQLDEKRE